MRGERDVPSKLSVHPPSSLGYSLVIIHFPSDMQRRCGATSAKIFPSSRCSFAEKKRFIHIDGRGKKFPGNRTRLRRMGADRALQILTF